MRTRQEVERVLALHAAGLNGPQTAYTYLLGLYLGDGCLSAHPRSVYRLRITCANAYPELMRRCELAMTEVLPNKVGRVVRQGCTDVYSFSKHWICLFPQHGPGRKHERRIELTAWQQELIDRDPRPLLEGLLHSDGCRVRNRANGTAYPRYHFSNSSADIRAIFGRACDALGIQWRPHNPVSLSVARRGAWRCWTSSWSRSDEALWWSGVGAGVGWAGPGDRLHGEGVAGGPAVGGARGGRVPGGVWRWWLATRGIAGRQRPRERGGGHRSRGGQWRRPVAGGRRGALGRAATLDRDAGDGRRRAGPTAASAGGGRRPPPHQRARRRPGPAAPPQGGAGGPRAGAAAAGHDGAGWRPAPSFEATRPAGCWTTTPCVPPTSAER
jgi:hypothetical protein